MGLQHRCLRALLCSSFVLFVPLRTSILQRFCVIYDRSALTSRPDITRKYWSCCSATWLIGSICGSPLAVSSAAHWVGTAQKRPWCFACSRSWYLATTTSICWWRSENITVWVLPDHNPHRSSLVQVQDQVSIERNQNMQCIQIWGLQKPLFAGTEIILVGNLMTVIKPQPSHLMSVILKWKQIVDFNCGTNDFFCFDAQGSYKHPGSAIASTGMMTSLAQK
jgi:hypothetical protein